MVAEPEMSIPGLDWGMEEVMLKDQKKPPTKKVPYAKPIPAQFQQVSMMDLYICFSSTARHTVVWILWIQVWLVVCPSLFILFNRPGQRIRFQQWLLERFQKKGRMRRK